MSTPVVSSSTLPIAGPVLPVVEVSDEPTHGGAATPVYVVSAAELAAGTFGVLTGGTPLRVTTVADARPTIGMRPLPVYVVSGGIPPPPPEPIDPRYVPEPMLQSQGLISLGVSETLRLQTDEPLCIEVVTQAVNPTLTNVPMGLNLDFWRRPIGGAGGTQSATDANSATIVGVWATAIGSGGTRPTSSPNTFAAPMYVVPTTAARSTVTYSGVLSEVDANGILTVLNPPGSGTISVPVPLGVAQSRGSDGWVIIIDGDTGDEWGFWQFRNAAGTFTCTNCYYRALGLYRSLHMPVGFESRGAGCPYTAGLLMGWEIEAAAAGNVDAIQHKLAWAYDQGTNRWRTPYATQSDGTNTNPLTGFAYGSVLRLSPTLTEGQIAAWESSLTAQEIPVMRAIVRALQTYGMVLVDFAGQNLKIVCEDFLTWDYRNGRANPIISSRTVRNIGYTGSSFDASLWTLMSVEDGYSEQGP